MSVEVQTLRTIRDKFLRKTEVGFAFFQELFYDYYSFSPQVCTMMVREPKLSALLLEGFVRPLINALKLLQAYAFDKLTDVQLGRLLISYHPNRSEVAAHLALLRQVDRLFQCDAPSHQKVVDQLTSLLRERAWTSAHVQWALIEPVRIYAKALKAFTDNSSPSQVGRKLRLAFASWGAAMPIGHVWATLPAQQLATELNVLESHLLRTAKMRIRFKKRLIAQFGDITAIRSVLDRRSATSGVLYDEQERKNDRTA